MRTKRSQTDLYVYNLVKGEKPPGSSGGAGMGWDGMGRTIESNRSLEFLRSMGWDVLVPGLV